MDDPQNTRLEYVKVTNHLDVPFTDRYDGVPVTIEAGKSKNLELSVAAHILGYRFGVDDETMFRHVTKRQGWNTVEYNKPAPANDRKTYGRWLFERLKIEPVTYRLVEEKADPTKPVPALATEEGHTTRGKGAAPAAYREQRA